jgi:hypothetical protein
MTNDQIPITKRFWVTGNWNLFGTWNLIIGISYTTAPLFLQGRDRM